MTIPIQSPPMDPWAPGVRAADVPVVDGGGPNPFDDFSDEFETFDDDVRLEREGRASASDFQDWPDLHDHISQLAEAGILPDLEDYA
jgi:hypothetical protein